MPAKLVLLLTYPRCLLADLGLGGGVSTPGSA